MRDLESLLERLIKHRVEFVLVGGFAAVAHGATLLTEDIDICCPFTAENLLKLDGAVRDLSPVHRLTPNRLPLELTPESITLLKNLYLDTDYGQLDCLGVILGVGEFADVKNCSIEVRLPFGECRVLKIDALIAAKEALNRPRDKLAIRQLQAIRERLI
jgi:hypothetical protein